MSLQDSSQVCSSGSLRDVLLSLKSFLLPWILAAEVKEDILQVYLAV